MANRSRNVRIEIKVSEEEKAIIEKKMQVTGIINISRYARKMMLDGYVNQMIMSRIIKEVFQ